ncbi:AEC family transporter [Pseudoflavonifractor phocaeensis]|uniref:AEC family transporter n=1 Tax=Pseudoflavonifractor phocaeensis TaxID=1870988 RepID=UPI00195EF641|nr:AEC family transporter [Pseudoflavonifractor phocaeensis]MBM6870146.1 AEC family transporter [Pseudoflavonifractor phocaeensis]
MLERIWVVFSQVITLFLLMGVGFFLARKNKLTSHGVTECTYLLLYFVAPCIIIESLQVDRDSQLTHSVLLCVAASVGLYLLYILMSLPTFRKQPPKTRSVLQFGAVYGNLGFMGIPLVQAVLGDDAVVFVVFVLAIFTVTYWIHGVFIMGGPSALSLKSTFLNPGVIPLLISLPLFLTGWRLPSMVNSAVSFLADLNTPLAMVVIGAQMARSDLLSIFRQPRLYASCAFRLLLCPAVTALVLLPLHMDPLLYATMVILAGTPTAGVTSMFAQRFEQDTPSAAQLVSLSTLLSVVTLPLCAALAEALTR